jgi:stearoyl-CoA desaturase (Delta-9 desaturase)
MSSPFDSPPRVRHDLDRLRWNTAPFFAFHLVALVLAIWVGPSWAALAWCVGLYYGRMLFVSIGYHRYFAHRTFRTGRVRQFLIAFFAQTSVQKGALWWAAHHRSHHRYSDRPEDPHSPRQRGFWWAHLGWILSNRYTRTEVERIRDFARFPELVWLNRHHWVPPAILGVTLYLVGGLTALTWGFFVSTVFLWQGTFVINSLAHRLGRRRFETNDDSRNSLIFALITCGEGWHNNHHRYQHSAAQGFYWWQIDFSKYALKIASWLRLVRNLVKPTPEVLSEGRRKSRGSLPAGAPA